MCLRQLKDFGDDFGNFGTIASSATFKNISPSTLSPKTLPRSMLVTNVGDEMVWCPINYTKNHHIHKIASIIILSSTS